MNIQPSVQFGKLTIREKSIKDNAPTTEYAERLLSDLRRRYRHDVAFKNIERLGLDVEMGLGNFKRAIAPEEHSQKLEKMWEKMEGKSKNYFGEPVSYNDMRNDYRTHQELAKREPEAVGLYAKIISRGLGKPIAMMVQDLPKDGGDLFEFINSLKKVALWSINSDGHPAFQALSKEEQDSAFISNGFTVGESVKDNNKKSIPMG